MKNLFLIIIFCLITNLLLSQNNNPNKKRENREAIKIAFFTKKMDLNTVESQNFWPLVNDMEAELKALKNILTKQLEFFQILKVFFFLF